MVGADIRVEIVYARSEEQVVVELTLPAHAPLRSAIERSGLLERFPEIDLDVQPVGIFGAKVALDRPLVDGDRVEIYRPLAADPKAARRRRAGQARRRSNP